MPVDVTSAPEEAAASPRANPLGWRAEQRPSPGIARAVGAAAGVLAGAAVVLLTAWIDREDPQVPGALLTVALLAVSLAAAVFVAGPPRSAALGEPGDSPWSAPGTGAAPEPEPAPPAPPPA